MVISLYTDKLRITTSCIMLYSKVTKMLQYSVIQLIPQKNLPKFKQVLLYMYQSKDCLTSDYLKALKLDNIKLFTSHPTFCHIEVLRRWIQPNVE